jgi:hypothetical protein
MNGSGRLQAPAINKMLCGFQSWAGHLAEEVRLLHPWPSQYSDYIILTPSKQEIKLKILFGRRLSSTVGYY